MRYLLLLIISFCSIGCSGEWVYNRARDFTDPLTVNLCAGPSATLGVKVTGAVHILLGGGVHREFGLYQGHWGWSEVESTGFPLNFAYPTEGGDDWMEVKRESSWEEEGRYKSLHACRGSHFFRFHQENPPADIKRSLDLELTNTLIVGYRIGFSLVEFVDFIVGLVGIDPAGDDNTMREYDGEGPIRDSHYK